MNRYCRADVLRILHITAKQLRHYVSALLQGDPQALQIVKSSAREWWEGLMPARN